MPYFESTSRRCVLMAMAVLTICLGAVAQVHYHEDRRPWKQTVSRGPDKDVPGWFYNLGTTGLRVQLMPEEPKHLLVKHVLEGSPAARAIRPGDVLVGTGGRAFASDHRNGYGMEVFGPDGPILEFARAIEACQGPRGSGCLRVSVRLLPRIRRPFALHADADVRVPRGKASRAGGRRCQRASPGRCCARLYSAGGDARRGGAFRCMVSVHERDGIGETA